MRDGNNKKILTINQDDVTKLEETPSGTQTPHIGEQSITHIQHNTNKAQSARPRRQIRALQPQTLEEMNSPISPSGFRKDVFHFRDYLPRCKIHPNETEEIRQSSQGERINKPEEKRERRASYHVSLISKSPNSEYGIDPVPYSNKINKEAVQEPRDALDEEIQRQAKRRYSQKIESSITSAKIRPSIFGSPRQGSHIIYHSDPINNSPKLPPLTAGATIGDFEKNSVQPRIQSLGDCSPFSTPRSRLTCLGPQDNLAGYVCVIDKQFYTQNSPTSYGSDYILKRIFQKPFDSQENSPTFHFAGQLSPLSLPVSMRYLLIIL